MSAKSSKRLKSSVSEVLSDTNSETDISTKLRRLRIEENVISQSIRKTSEQTSEETYECQTQSQFFFENIKESVNTMKTLFEDIQSRSNGKHNLEVLDVFDIKMDVLDLESKIKSFKAFIVTELTAIKLEEQELIQILNDNTGDKDKNTKLKAKVKMMPIKDVIPSPVKTFMNSPSKCQEVQDLQDFMANSKNRYGGWIPYNHFIFEQIYHKHTLNNGEGNTSRPISRSKRNTEHISEKIIEEVLQKIRGIDREEIIAHCQWYSKYLYLKTEQQKALVKWRATKKLIKKAGKAQVSARENCPETSVQENKANEDVITVMELVSDELQEMERLNHQEREFNENDNEIQYCTELYEDDHIQSTSPFSQPKMKHLYKLNSESVKMKSGYKKSTVQWINRCQSYDDSSASSSCKDVEQIDKLRIPAWRVTLKQH